MLKKIKRFFLNKKMDSSCIQKSDTKTEKKGQEDVQFIDIKQIDTKELMEMWDKYATKKTATAGFFNMALLANNFMTLRTFLTSKRDLENSHAILHIVIIVATVISILMQVFAGLVLIFLGKNTLAGSDKIRKLLTKNNDLVTTVVFGIFVVNIMINIFSMAE